MGKPLVLVIEDEEDIRELMRYNLEREGFAVRETETGEQGLVVARRAGPDLILLDLMLPGIQGLEVCRRLRAASGTRDTPMIIISAKGEEADVVAGLEMGADDYITKPFSPRELVARARSVLRRGPLKSGSGAEGLVRVASIEVDSIAHEVRVDGERLEMTLAEFRLLRALAANPGRVLSRAQLVRAITGGGHHIVERNVDVHVRSVRKKLGPAQALLRTVRGVGYKIDE